MAKKTQKSSQFKTIKEMVFSHFDKNGLDDIDHDLLVTQAKQIKKDTKYNKYHTSYWKSKWKTAQKPEKAKSAK